MAPAAATALEARPFRDHEPRRVNVADQDAGGQQLHPFARDDGALDRPTVDQRADMDPADHDALCADLQRSVRMHVPFQAAVDPHGAGEAAPAFQGQAGSHERADLIVPPDRWLPEPHDVAGQTGQCGSDTTVRSWGTVASSGPSICASKDSASTRNHDRRWLSGWPHIKQEPMPPSSSHPHRKHPRKRLPYIADLP
jgi:hypothetical protein